MDNWFALPLGDGILASAPLAQIEESFPEYYFDRAGPDVAVFVQYATEGDLHCEVTAYFAPAAAELARAFQATPCPPPARHGLQLLAGDPECWERLFVMEN